MGGKVEVCSEEGGARAKTHTLAVDTMQLTGIRRDPLMGLLRHVGEDDDAGVGECLLVEVEVLSLIVPFLVVMVLSQAECRPLSV